MSIDLDRVRNMPFEYDKDRPEIYDIRLAIGEALGGICTSHPDWVLDVVAAAAAYRDAYCQLRSVMSGSDKDRADALAAAEHLVECARLQRNGRFQARQDKLRCACELQWRQWNPNTGICQACGRKFNSPAVEVKP